MTTKTNEFEIGDKVITACGTVGEIVNKKHNNGRFGFVDYKIDYYNRNGDKIGSKWITRYDRAKGYDDFYQIGDHIFGNKHIDKLKRMLYDIEEQKSEIEYKLAFLQSIKGE